MLTYHTKIPFYKNDIKSTTPISLIDLTYFLRLIKYSNNNLRSIFDEIKQPNIDPKKKAELKQHLFYTTPCIMTDMQGRGYKNITAFTGVLVLDFDKINNAVEFKHYLFDTYKFIFACWVSTSGNGVRAFVSIPESTDVEEFKQYFWGLAHEVMFAYNGFDIAPQNCVLPLFISYDPNILVRKIDAQWSIKKIKSIVTPQIEPIRFRSSNIYEKWSIDNFRKSIDKINDNGHPQLRAAAYALGGRVGAGYISEYSAINEANNIITTNLYLAKGYAGYKRTAKEMILKGKYQPLYFK
jgi:CRISPR/Cas system CSM-associated protein Csm2 small subunit